MHHIGLICPEYSGHLNPMRTLGRHLQRWGYRVSLIARPDAQPRAVAARLGYVAIGTTEFPRGSLARRQAELGRLTGLRAIRFTINELHQASSVILRDAPAAITAAGVDALLVDQAAPAGGTVADKLGLPYVTVCNALALDRDSLVPPPLTAWHYRPTAMGRVRNRLGYALMERLARPVVAQIATQRVRWGLPPLRTSQDLVSPLAEIAQQPAAFDFPRGSVPPVFHHTGPFHDATSGDAVPFPFERLSQQPLVYASLGTLQNRLHHIFHCIAAACADLDVQLVVSLGSSDQVRPPNLPGDPIVVPYAPQLALLDRAALVITHAGLNTTLEALSRGVPLVAIPITNDQPGVAARIVWTGVGTMLPVARLSVPRLRASIRQVLADARFRGNAARLQAAIAEADGLRRAVEIAETALVTTSPVVRAAGI